MRRAYWWLSSTILFCVPACSSYGPMKCSVGPAITLILPVSVSLILAYCCSSSWSAFLLRAALMTGMNHAVCGPLTTEMLDGDSSTSCSSGFKKVRKEHDIEVAERAAL